MYFPESTFSRRPGKSPYTLRTLFGLVIDDAREAQFGLGCQASVASDPSKRVAT